MSRFLALVLALLVSTSALAEELPAQIGRLATISGAVSFHATADATGSEVSVNYPLTTGNRLATPPRGHATIDIAAGRFYLDADSAMTLGALGPGVTTVSLEQGALILRILPGGAGQVFIVQTPRGALRADQPGYFEVEVAAETGTVVATALEGGAQFNETTVLPPGTRATLTTDAEPRLDGAVADDFVRRVAAEVEASGENQLDAPKYVSPQATGFVELQRYGLWVMTEQYGPVWEPQVMSDWAPFHDGRWVEIAPWGKTWIDNAPWGFAPSHYGRWTKVNDRWVWIPGNAAPPVASFFGTRDQNDQGAVGWVPLGPEKPVLADSSPVIVNNVRVISPAVVPKVTTVTHVTNTTNVTNVVQQDRRRGFSLFNGHVPNPPPSPPPGGVSRRPNLTGLGAAGTPIGAGVGFPGQR